ncbi:response regulator [Guptibacillus hwajinpoensis]|uniref:NarL family two-component system response regulator LiaR n=1 Tax=Guptibacillus hwajinpoensis TaxID=208199 RepID=A0ABU0K825_9BACL|nr:response regulator transcription factor [Alkalihalobacillus hemicentroti]MDQ0484272.1 NarL family two-component system response regulator LiaR [Alkalihalobacillus hemicentroti]
MGNTINVMIVDDHDMVRKGLKAYLLTEPDLFITGEASNGKEAVTVANELKPDVILMDLIMPEMTGIEATREIMANHPSIKIIIITSFYDDEQVFPAIEAGAFSYLLKTASADEIISTIRKAVLDESVIEQKVAQRMMNQLRTKQQSQLHDELTRREKEVLLLIGQGKTNNQIAEELFIGLKTVKTHVSNILSKLNVQDRTQAAVYAIRNGLTR